MRNRNGGWIGMKEVDRFYGSRMMVKRSEKRTESVLGAIGELTTKRLMSEALGERTGRVA